MEAETKEDNDAWIFWMHYLQEKSQAVPATRVLKVSK